MKRKMNRIISLLLSAMLVFSALPEAVFAYDGEQESEEAVLTEAIDDGESMPEPAVDDLPEADGASESEDNNSVEKANPISVNTEYSGNISEGGDKDYYRFQLDEDGVVSFSFSHEYVDSDYSHWRLRLYQEGKTNDELLNRTFTGDEMQTVTTSSVGLPAGYYIVLISDASKRSANTYKFTVNYTKSDAWEKERNNSFDKPNAILTNKEYSGSIENGTDLDYYRFHLDEDGVVTFSFSHEFVDSDYTHWRIRLFREDNTKNELLNRTFTGDEKQTVTTSSVGLPAGYYILLVRDSSKQSANTYKFTVNYTKSDAWEREQNDTFNSPNAILTNKEYSGSIENNTDLDYYRFHLDEDGVVTFSFSHEFVDSDYTHWRIRLFRDDDTKNELLNRTFTGDEKKTVTTSSVGLPAGYYVLLVMDSSKHSANTYKFTVNYTKSDAWEKERNNSSDKANDILINKEYSGSIENSNDADYFRFHLEADGAVSFSFSHEYVDNDYTNWVLSLYPDESVNKELYSQSFIGNEKKTITTSKTKLQAGYYIIKITDSSKWSDATYRFTVNDASSGKPKKESNPTDVIPGGGGATDPQPLLTMDKEQSIVLVKGQKFMMADAGWKSDAKKIVSVSKKTVKAKAAGETKLSLGDYSINVKVVSVEQTKNEKNLQLEAGESGMISLGGINAQKGKILIGGEELPICFMTSAPDVAVVDDSGAVRAVAAGTATVTAYINGVAFKCKVKVSESTPQLRRTLHVNLGKGKNIKIKGLNKAEWVPTEGDIVKINKNKVTGLNAGTSTLTCGEYVVDVFVEDPSIVGSSKPFAQTLTMKAKTEETIELKKVDQDVLFISNKPYIAWVDENGVIHARSKGTAKLTAKINGRSVKITVKVE